ncbi:hypothetical protein J7T55_001051 [Diaporthe amygdali]|uniref:uncharacterized protein n=1 Tax=Phomopsis amygdali TaxID=1214568 RepID=UPI0022FDCA48|nr:uncharacterized protein J7T55_001051 [Diaporthe amygdali]KAJ0120195.1 hypothetical protein J7T55_001051 [Diaporthe amygdali]
MAGDKSMIPSNQPEKLNDILKQEKRDYDCTPWGTAFLGLAGYSYVSGMSQLEKQRAVILKSNSWLGMRGRKMGIGVEDAGRLAQSCFTGCQSEEPEEVSSKADRPPAGTSCCHDKISIESN